MPTHQTSLGISISVFAPLIQGTWLIESIFNHKVSSYTHTTVANGGYWNASITLNDSQDNIEDWIDSGLGRRIVTYNEAGLPIWEGFVNVVKANIGALSFTRGPLLDVSNKVSIVYGTVNTSTSPPTLGIRIQTSKTEDTPSQEKYGIIETVLSTGGATADNATDLRDTYLSEYKEPQSSQTINLQVQSEPSVTLEVLGYVHWLNKYTYSSTTTGVQDLDAKIEAILGQEPNGYISTDYSNIEANTLQVKAYEQNIPNALPLINSLVSMGDASANRFVFGVYNGRVCHYNQIPSAIENRIRLASNTASIETSGGAKIQPQNVLPANWLFVSDFLAGRNLDTSNLRLDPRAIFMESVSYSIPNALQAIGGKVSTTRQKLGRLGLSGIGGA